MITVIKRKTIGFCSKNKLMIVIGIAATITLLFALIVSNNVEDIPIDTPLYSAYIPDQDVVLMIQSQLNNEGFNFITPNIQNKLSVTATRDSTGGQVSAEIILFDEEKDISIAFVDKSQWNINDHRIMIANLITRVFESQHNVAVANVFFNFEKLTNDAEEKKVYMEKIKIDIAGQIQEFIDQLRRNP